MRTSIHGFVLAMMAVVWSSATFARNGSKLDYVTFRETCVMVREGIRTVIDVPPTVGTTAYFPTGALEAGQTRFSFVRLRKTMRKAIKPTKTMGSEKPEPNAHFDKQTQQWTFLHDEGRSLFPLKKKMAGVYYRGRIYIVDGHHRGLISTYLMATTVPVEILADWSYLSPRTFRRFTSSEPNHYAHWRDYQGRDVEPVDLCQLTNDPNLLLARLLLLRVDVRLDEAGQPVVDDVRGGENALMIKVNQDIPFYEFEIADALRRAGVVFDDRRREHDLTRRELRHYLKILKAARDEPGSRLRHILLLDKPTPTSKLALPTLIMDHVRARGCHELLTTRARAED